MMQPNEISFCVHALSEIELDQSDKHSDYDSLNIITFCPADYWKEHECLPDYYFADEIDDALLPAGYKWYLFVEECQWATKKSKEEIQKDLIKIGFVNNLLLENFLSSCY